MRTAQPEGRHMFCIQAQQIREWRDARGNPCSSSRQLPTFYLHPDVQGVDEDGAVCVAKRILGAYNPDSLAEGVRFEVSAVWVEVSS